MLNRRLIFLFILFIVGFAALGFRLASLQLAGADRWQNQMREALHRHQKIETSRGQILDRYRVTLAHDVVCDDLAIDYRAMNLDDKWLTDAARARLKNEKFADAGEQLRRIAETKADIAARIDTLPDVISKVCNLSKEDVLERFQEIRQRIHALHEDYWSRRYNRQNPTAPDVDDQESIANSLDTSFKKTDIKDERLSHTIVHALSNDIANYFRQHLDEFPGLVVLDNADTRAYGPLVPPPDAANDQAAPYDPTYAESACQIVGTLRNINADAITDKSKLFDYPNLLADNPNDHPGNLAGYLPGDEMGESGAEKYLESQLHGTRGVRLNERFQPNAEPEKRIDPIPGKDVLLTIDIKLQHDLYNALIDPAKHLLRGQDGKDHFVALVILSLDGQVLSMISLPTYDPNRIETMRNELNADEYHRPLANRALQAYQPGSTVKPLLASAALTEKVITPETTINCNGYLFPNRPNIFRCSVYVETNGRASHGPLQLEDAIAESCNIYFYNVGRLLGLEKLTHWFDLYGLGRDTGFELPEANGSLPSADTLADPDAAKTESLFLGIGQGHVSASPLQMANAYATLLRSGLDIAPRLLLDEPQKRRQRFQLDPAILATVKAGMRGVVTRGTGKEIFAGFNLPIGGKTGTADTSRPAFDEKGQPLFRPLLDDAGQPRLDATGKPLLARVSEKGTDAWFLAYAPRQRTLHRSSLSRRSWSSAAMAVRRRHRWSKKHCCNWNVTPTCPRSIPRLE